MFGFAIVFVLLAVGLLLSSGLATLNSLDKGTALPLRGILVLLVVGEHLLAELGLDNEGNLRRVIARSPVVIYFSAVVLFAGIYGLDCFSYFPVRFFADHLFLAVLGPVVALVMYRVRLPGLFGAIGVISYEMYIVHGAFVGTLHQCIPDKMIYACGVLLCTMVAGAALKWSVCGVRFVVQQDKRRAVGQ